VPPVAVAIIAGCGADLVINICLTLLGYFPGHIHAFYLIYVMHKKRETGDVTPAAGVYSDRINNPGYTGTNAAPINNTPPASSGGYAAPPAAGYPTQAPAGQYQQQGGVVPPAGAKY